MGYIPIKIIERGEQNRWDGVSPCYATQNGAEMMREEMIGFICYVTANKIEMDGKTVKEFDREDFIKLYELWAEKKLV